MKQLAIVLERLGTLECWTLRECSFSPETLKQELSDAENQPPRVGALHS